jgi:hypothetical protein
METQTLEQFKAMQRFNMQELISKGRLINSVTGFECSKMLDDSVRANEKRKIKKKWAKYAKQSK